MIRRSFFSTLSALFAAAFLLLAGADAARAQVFGAIYSTNVAGSVNVNIYPSKDAVYVNGGPRKEGAAGLPDGSYYIKVTTPDGDLLGSSPTAIAQVVGGEFVQLYQLVAILVKASDGLPGYDTTTNNGGEYKLWASQDPNFPPSESKTDNFKVLRENPPPTGQMTLNGRKFYDGNVSGTDDSEPGVGGVRIQVRVDGTLIEGALGSGFTTVTGADGSWSLTISGAQYTALAGKVFTVNELLPGTGEPGHTWVQTAPAADSFGARYYSGVVVNATVNNLDFGNYCSFSLTGGRTLGFWSNRNGQALIDPADLTELRALNLVDGNGDPFNPGDKTILRTWLLNGNAVNMAYMLSVQLSATHLSVLNNLQSVGTNVVLEGVFFNGMNLGDTYGEGIVNIGDLIAEANAELGLHPNTPAGSGSRSYQEVLKNILDAINNNALVGIEAAGECDVVYP